MRSTQSLTVNYSFIIVKCISCLMWPFNLMFNCVFMCMQNHRTVACVERKLRVLPSSRISRLEVYRQEEGSEDVMVLQNAERIDWTAGDTLGNLRFKLYDEGNRLVSLLPKLTSKIKVWFVFSWFKVF